MQVEYDSHFECFNITSFYIYAVEDKHLAVKVLFEIFVNLTSTMHMALRERSLPGAGRIF